MPVDTSRCTYLWASNGRVAMSALGSGRACLTAVIAYCPSMPWSTQFQSTYVLPMPALPPLCKLAGSTGVSGSPGLCVLVGEGGGAVQAHVALPVMVLRGGRGRDTSAGVLLWQTITRGC